MVKKICPLCDKIIPLEGDWSDLYLGLSITRGFNGGEWVKYLCGQLFIKTYCCCYSPIDDSIENLEDLFNYDEQ